MNNIISLTDYRIKKGKTVRIIPFISNVDNNSEITIKRTKKMEILLKALKDCEKSNK